MGDNGKENGNYRDYWGYIGVMEKKMETTIMGYIGYIILKRRALGLHRTSLRRLHDHLLPKVHSGLGLRRVQAEAQNCYIKRLARTPECLTKMHPPSTPRMTAIQKLAICSRHHILQCKLSNVAPQRDLTDAAASCMYKDLPKTCLQPLCTGSKVSAQVSKLSH